MPTLSPDCQQPPPIRLRAPSVPASRSICRRWIGAVFALPLAVPIIIDLTLYEDHTNVIDTGSAAI
jgi:hypothetical protein